MVPDDIGDDIAARAYINPLAAYLMLRRWPAHDKRVLLTAAGSSCALLLAQWAIEHGAREVFGIYRSPEHAEALAKLGTIPVSIKETENIAKLARQDALVFDAVGGSLATLILNAMPPEATLVTYGLLSGQAFSLDGARTQPQRFHLRDQLRATAPDEWQAWFRALWPLLRRVVLPATQTFPLGRWREALSLFQQSGRRVKPLLVMR
jgi:NADPH:quinone reductase-like Zn-dependent oxidoreductase